jgi:HlyD family secretion protein
MTRKGKRIVGGVIVLLAVGGLVAWNVSKDARSRIAVQTGKVAKKDLVSVVTASGEVRPRRYVNVGANVSGKITALYVKEGDKVRKGQPLVRIESERYEAMERQSSAGVSSATADLARAQADLEVSKLNFDRAKKMLADKLIAEQTYDQTDAEYRMKVAAVESSRKRVAQLQAALDSTRDDLSKTVVTSSMDGVITSLPKEEGEVVIGAQSFSPTVIMTVADLSVMECEIMVDETDIRALSLGQTAKIKVDALENVEILGKVTEIGASAVPRGLSSSAAAASSGSGNTGNQAKDFKVTITLENPPATLRPGLNASAEITTAKREGVLAVPIQAVVVREVDEKGKVVDPDAAPAQEERSGNTVVAGVTKKKNEEKEGVFILEKEKTVFKPVKTGILGESDVEILEGVTDGQDIVTGSFKTLRTLREGARVKVEKKKERS